MKNVVAAPTNPLFKPGTKTEKVFATSLSGANAAQIGKAGNFLKKYWGLYPQGTPSLNGNVFETLVAIAMRKKGFIPLYHQTHIAFVPNVKFDLVIYSEEFGPMVLSVKTSLRERYKQVDLEGWVLKQVHRQARTYLITADRPNVSLINKKIANGEVMGIEKVVYALDKDIDNLIFELSQLTLKKPGTADIMTAKTILT